MSRRSLVAAAVAIALVPAAGAGPGAPQPWVPNDGVDALAVAGDSLFLGGDFERLGPRTGHFVVSSLERNAPRLLRGHVSGPVYAMVDDGRGGWFIGGDFPTVGGVACPYLAHIRADGDLDRRWCPAPNAGVRALARSGNALYVGGFFGSIGGRRRALTALVDTRTGRASGWNARMHGEETRAGSAAVRAIAIKDRTVIPGGVFERAGGRRRHILAAVDARTGTATAWNPDPHHSNVDSGIDALVAAGSTLYVGGDFSLAGGASRSGAAAFDLQSGRVLPWDPSVTGEVEAIAVVGSRVFLGGRFTLVGRHERLGLAAVDGDSGRVGAWDARADGPVEALATVGGRLVVGGGFGRIGGHARSGLAALDLGTARATSWNPNPDDMVWSLALSRGALGVGGSFGSAGRSVSREKLAAVSLATGEPRSPHLGLGSNCCGVRLLGDGATLYVAGSFARIGGSARPGLAAVDVGSGRLRDWSPTLPKDWCEYGGCRLAALGSTIYLSGDFGSVGGASRRNLAAVDAATGAPTAWAPQPDDDVSALMPTTAAVYVAGDFEQIGGAARPGLAAVDPRTGTALRWSPLLDEDGAVSSIAAVGSTVYLAGSFATVNGTPRRGFAAVDATTGELLPWNPSVSWSRDEDETSGWLVVASGSHVYIAGRFDRASSVPRAGLAAVDATTGGLAAWVAPVSGFGSVQAIVPHGDRVYIGGYFDERVVVVPAAR